MSTTDLTDERIAEVRAWEAMQAERAATPTQREAFLAARADAQAAAEQHLQAYAQVEADLRNPAPTYVAPMPDLTSARSAMVPSLAEIPAPPEVIALREANASRAAAAAATLEAERLTMRRLGDGVASAQAVHDQAQEALVSAKLAGTPSSGTSRLLTAVVRASADLEATKAGAERQAQLVADLEQAVETAARQSAEAESEATLAYLHRERAAQLVLLTESAQLVAASLLRIRNLDEAGTDLLQRRARKAGDTTLGVTFAPKPFNRASPEAALYAKPEATVADLLASLGAI